MTLWTAGNTTDKPLGPLLNGDVINVVLMGTNKLSVVAEYTGTMGSVQFFYGGKNFTESSAPYAMYGNDVVNRMRPVQYLQSLGEKSLTVKAFNAGGVGIGSISVTFTIVEKK